MRSCWRFRWEGLAVAWLCGLTASATVAFLPNVYPVNASIAVDSDVLARLVDKLYADGRRPTGAAEKVRAAMTHPEQLEKLVQAVAGRGQDHGWQNLEEKLRQLPGRLDIVEVGPQQGEYRVSLRDTYHRQSLVLVETAIQVLGDSINTTAQGIQDASGPVTPEQIAAAESRLAHAERQLSEFIHRNPAVLNATENVGAATRGGEAMLLSELEKRLRDAQQRLTRIETKLAANRTTAIGKLDAPGVNSATLDPLDARILELKAHLEQMRQELHSTHPDVVVTRKTLERLSAEREHRLVDSGLTVFDARNLPLGTSREYLDLLIEAGTTRNTIDRLESEIDKQSRLVANMRASIVDPSALRVELDLLRQKAGTARSALDALHARSRTTDSSTGSGVNVAFAIISPPAVSRLPASPDRKFWLVSATGGSIVLGCLVTFLLSLMRPVFYSAEQVKAVTRVPLVGLITHAWRERLRRKFRRELLAFSVGTVAFVSVSLFLFALQQHAAVL